MKAHQRSFGKSDEHLTPRWVWEPLGAFDLDPCASVVRPWDIARCCYTIEDDGLAQPWEGRVWCNPPFNRNLRTRWMQRMAEHRRGTLLIPAATETKAFQSHVWNAATAVCFLNTRPHFCDVQGKEQKENCGCSIALVAYGSFDRLALYESGLGKVVDL